MEHEHRHEHSSLGHLFEFRSVTAKRLILSLGVTVLIMFVELAGGIFTRSVALISDAGHMFTHCFALGISLGATIIARNPPCQHKTFGLYRAEILAAFVNGLFLVAVTGFIIYEAVERIVSPTRVFGFHMLAVALLGLVANIASILILRPGQHHDLNVKSAVYHMLADAASSVAVVVAAIVIMRTGLTIVDPVASIGISVLILAWAIGILRQSTRILLEMTPRGFDIAAVCSDLKTQFPQLNAIFNVHVWTITTNMLVFSAHMQLKDPTTPLALQEELISRINKYLAQHYAIAESTIQFAHKNLEVCNIGQILFR